MLEKLKNIKARHIHLTQEAAKPELIANQAEWRAAMKEMSNIAPIADAYDRLDALTKSIATLRAAMKEEKDAEMFALMQEEFDNSNVAYDALIEEIKILLLPKDPDDDKNVIIEIRAGAGGDEAGLFGGDLERMYKMYAASQRWQVEDLDRNDKEGGGIKEVSFLITGKDVYARLKYESGVHRVQRVPDTETQGRIHTSTATVAVLPEVEDVEITIDEKDLKIDTYRSGGAGGQHVNKTESAIRITHIPTGIIVACQEERSQIKNREKAMKMLKSKMYDMQKIAAEKEYADNRKSQIGSGDRSERIRTYNFPQGRVTDHRINYTLYSIDAFMNGDIGEMSEQLALADRARKLSSNNE